jgi:hypothetical protein
VRAHVEDLVVGLEEETQGVVEIVQQRMKS